jgi:phosphate/sulfate permease
VKFGFVDAAVVRRLAEERKDAASVQLKATFFSLLLLGLAVAVAYAVGGNVWALAAGIFLPRAILVADAWLRPNPFPEEQGRK